jgi:hypothetical protein
VAVTCVVYNTGTRLKLQSKCPQVPVFSLIAVGPAEDRQNDE